MMRRNDLTVPNVLSVLRIALTPVIAWLLVKDTALWGPVAIFVAATDIFDGQLARRFKWESELGRQLDPVADVVYNTGIAIGLAVAGVLPTMILTAMLLQKGLKTVVAAHAYIHLHGPKLHVSYFGKITELVTSMGVAGFMLAELIANPELYESARIGASILTTFGVTAGFINVWLMKDKFHELKLELDAQTQ